MKKHLLTIALAIVALGGAVASTAHRTSALDPIVAGPINSVYPQCDVRTLDCDLTGTNVCTIEEIPGQPINLYQYTDIGDDAGKCTTPLFYTGK